MQVVTEKSYARIGLVGNPSDGYEGKTLAVVCKNFFAEVTLIESERLVIEPDLHEFDSVLSLQQHIRQDGYYGASRLFKATLKLFTDYVGMHHQAGFLDRNFSVSYRTNIPRMVGLAGSSALVVAMLKALMAFYSVSIDKQVLASVALAAEKDELNIGGGLQDRVVQIYEGVVAMDFSQLESIGGYQCGRYQSIDASLLPPLYLAYSVNGGEPTEVFHNDLRARYNTGETLVVNAMRELAALTDQSLAALNQGDTELFNQLLDRNFDIRQSISNLNPHHVEMIRLARSCGVSAKYAGSGGAIVGVCTDEGTFSILKTKLNAIGCEIVKPEVT